MTYKPTPTDAVLKAIREANMQLVRTGDDAFMLVPYKAAKAQAAEPVAREPLTDEQIQDLLLCGDPTDEEMRLIRIGWDAARGIKGGQP